MNYLYALEFRTSSAGGWGIDLARMSTDKQWVESAVEWGRRTHGPEWEFRVATFQRVRDPNEVVDSLLTAAEEAKKKEGW